MSGIMRTRGMTNQLKRFILSLLAVVITLLFLLPLFPELYDFCGWGRFWLFWFFHRRFCRRGDTLHVHFCLGLCGRLCRSFLFGLFCFLGRLLLSHLGRLNLFRRGLCLHLFQYLRRERGDLGFVFLRGEVFLQFLQFRLDLCDLGLQLRDRVERWRYALEPTREGQVHRLLAICRDHPVGFVIHIPRETRFVLLGHIIPSLLFYFCGS